MMQASPMLQHQFHRDGSASVRDCEGLLHRPISPLTRARFSFPSHHASAHTWPSSFNLFSSAFQQRRSASTGISFNEASVLECMGTRLARCTLPDQTRHTRDLISKIQGWLTNCSFVLLGLSPSYGLDCGPSDLCSTVYDSAIHICLLRSFVACRPAVWFRFAW
jgi:hypothetical protein